MYADDTKCYRPVRALEDAQYLQHYYYLVFNDTFSHKNELQCVYITIVIYIVIQVKVK
jgi:hypothetical protein